MSWGEVSCNCLRMKNPFRYFKTSPEIIRLAVMMQVRFPLSLRNVEDLLHERGIEVSHETIRCGAAHRTHADVSVRVNNSARRLVLPEALA